MPVPAFELTDEQRFAQVAFCQQLSRVEDLQQLRKLCADLHAGFLAQQAASSALARELCRLEFGGGVRG